MIKSLLKIEILMKKYTLITGASSGLGIDFANEYAKQNENLILVARRVDRLNQIKNEIESKYAVDVIVYPLDLNHNSEINQFFEQLDSDIFIHRLINNAGFGYSGSFVNMQESQIRSMISVNIEALTILAHKVIPNMIEHKQGEILNVGSIAAFVPGPYMAEYYASKAYVLSYSIALHEELKEYNIKVSVLCPGPTKTEFFDVANSHKENKTLDNFMMDSYPVVRKGVSDLKQNKPISIVGLSNHSLRAVLKLVPRTFASKIVGKIQKKSR